MMAVALALALIALPAAAALPVGRTAPDFTTMGALAVKAFRFHLAEQLRHGPVVLYFYPEAYDVKIPLVKMTNRTSYVIAKNGRIVFVHSDLDWKEHVAKTLAAVRALKS